MSQEKNTPKNSNLSFSYLEISLLLEFQKEHGSRWRVTLLFLIYPGPLAPTFCVADPTPQRVVPVHHNDPLPPSSNPQGPNQPLGLWFSSAFLHVAAQILGSRASSRARLSGLRPSSPAWTPGPVCSDYLSALRPARQARRRPGAGRAAAPTGGEPTSARAGLSVPVTLSDRRAAVHRSGRQRSANRDHGGHTRTPPAYRRLPFSQESPRTSLRHPEQT